MFNSSGDNRDIKRLGEETPGPGSWRWTSSAGYGSSAGGIRERASESLNGDVAVPLCDGVVRRKIVCIFLEHDEYDLTHVRVPD